jgi:hypothetical protein
MYTRLDIYILFIYLQDYILTTNEISTIETFSETTLFTGCSNGKLISWDIERSAVDKM